MTKVLKIGEDPTAKHESTDDKMTALMDHIQNMHLACSESGKSYVVIIDRGEGNIRMLSGPDLEKLTKYVQDTEKVDGPFITVNYIEVQTRQ
jgi:hypothetical protein